MKLAAYGAIAGFLATVPMTAAMVLIHARLPRDERYPLPPVEITEEALEKVGLAPAVGPVATGAASGLSHYGFGASMGAVYASTAYRAGGAPAVSGVGFGLLTWALSYFGWIPALRLLRPAWQHPPRRNALMAASHAVWGVSLGLLTHALVTRNPETEQGS